MKAGDRVKVDFIGESATIYSGKRFTGYGVLDRVEDGRVYGRLDDGTPFMCLCADVEVVGMSDFEKWFKSLNENGRVTYFLGQEGRISEEAWNHQQSKIDELQKQVDAAKQLIEDLNKCYQQDHQNKFEYWRGFADSAGILRKRLEQALKGGNE